MYILRSTNCLAQMEIINYIFKEGGGVPEWLKGTDCKSVSSAFDGSNPSPTTILKIKDLQTFVSPFSFGEALKGY